MPIRAHILSDIHFECMDRDDLSRFWRQFEALQVRDPAEIAILAGDICTLGTRGKLWKKNVAPLCGPYKKVFYTRGNHELYGSSFAEMDQFMESINNDPNFSNLIHLDNNSYEYGGIRFHGGTMWFPELVTCPDIKRMMHDFHVIGSKRSPFEPEVYKRHQDFITNVMGKVQKGDVVISHHLPLVESISPLYAGSPLNHFFCANMLPHLKEENLPRLYFHGHTHLPFDYQKQVGSSFMRVVCNPLSYPNENSNLRFWERVGIDV